MTVAQTEEKRARGIYEKFRVERTDGKSAAGEKHDGCQYFVLDVRCDPQLNPRLSEWMMGFPAGWTSSAPLETQSIQTWLQRHGLT